MDLGDVYNRGFTSSYTSSPHEYCGRPIRIAWAARTPHRSKVRFQLRTADNREGLDNAEWLRPTGSGSHLTKPTTSLNLPQGRWIQFRAELDTDNGAYSLILEAVEIGFASQ